MTDPDREFDIQMMRLAIEQGRVANPSPNPPVGAVLVSADKDIVAQAYHKASGDDHVETVAIREAGEMAKGATLYVTLEPCNHVGKTPPCVDAILQAGIKRVVIGCVDPNPHVTGGGAQRLQDAGLDVEIGVAGAEARALIKPWTKYITTGRPHVALKLAVSLDGRIATRSGASKWVTGPEARVKVQHLRSLHDAVAVGLGTAKSDDPHLTVRDSSLLESRKPPVRVIFDTNLKISLSSRVVESARDVPTWIMAGVDASEDAEKALGSAGCTVFRVPMSGEGRVDIAAALGQMGEAGLVSVLFEGGAELAGSLLAARLADELHVFIAPLLLGPRGRPGAVDWAGPDTPADAPNIADPCWEVCGRDAYVSGSVSYPERS